MGYLNPGSSNQLIKHGKRKANLPNHRNQKTRNNENISQEAINKAQEKELFKIKVIGKDNALYTLEIFIRGIKSCRSKRDVARKTDPRTPIIYNHKNQPHAVIPSGYKLLLYAQRIALTPNQRIGQGNYVLFKFYADGEALSEGELSEASLSNPDVHWAKKHIESMQLVPDKKTVEHSKDANPFIGSFQIQVWTQLQKANVFEKFSAMPSDDRVFEKRKQRVCIANSDDGGVEVTRYDEPVEGLKERGAPQGVVSVSYDDLIGLRSRFPEFTVTKYKKAGVTDQMLKEAGLVSEDAKILGEFTIDEDTKDDISNESIKTSDETIADTKEPPVDVKINNSQTVAEETLIKTDSEISENNKIHSDPDQEIKSESVKSEAIDDKRDFNNNIKKQDSSSSYVYDPSKIDL